MFCKARCGDRSKPTPSITQACQYLWAPPTEGLGAEDPVIFKKMTDVISKNVEAHLESYFQELQLDEALARARVLKQNDVARLSGANGDIQDESMA